MISLNHITTLIIEQHAREVAVSYDDWAGLAEEMTTKRGCIVKRSTDNSRVTYERGDQHAYVMGALVYWAADLSRGETRVK